MTGTLDNSDTGDRRRYGETGYTIVGPNRNLTYTLALYMLAGRQPNVGAQVARYYTDPWVVTVAGSGQVWPDKLYLPKLMRTSPAQ